MQRFRRWGLQAAVVGKVLQEPIVRVLHHGAVAAEVPATALADDTPIEKHALLQEPPADLQALWSWTEQELPELSDAAAALLQLLDDPTIASKQWVHRQYDQQVLANTVVSSGAADAAVVRLRPQQGDGSMAASNRGVAATVDCPNRWVALDPERGAQAAVAEAARNLSCVGAEPLAVTDNLNFPSPETPKGFWQLAMACRGISDACRALNTPVTGGNVSLYNETKQDDGTMQPIHPTPVIGMVGGVDDISRVTGLAWQQPGDAIFLIGVPRRMVPIPALVWPAVPISSRPLAPWPDDRPSPILPSKQRWGIWCVRPLLKVCWPRPTIAVMAAWPWRWPNPASPLIWASA